MPSATRLRVDKLLVELGLSESREKAQRSILAGEVFVNERLVDKPGTLIPRDAQIRVAAPDRFVGRGGYKLEAALEHFSMNVAGLTCLDVGASTGGFTDCLLQRGAARVFAVDVGHNQLAWKMRSDPRVVVLEGVNARYLKPGLLGSQVGIAVADVSFISLTLILPSIFACVEPGGSVIVLIKPQFELNSRKVGKGGVVRDDEDRIAAVEKIRQFVLENLRREWRGFMASPISGAKGNKEFLACLH